ncbi:Methylated-DNA--protein-cysteine methyltransferase, inducible [compost metagenome]
MDKTQRKMKSKIGPLYLVASEKGLHGVFWKEQVIPLNEKSENLKAVQFIEQAVGEIEEFLQGKRKTFQVHLAPEGTDFQKRVWHRLAQIPYGVTKSYKDIACELDDPKACRAVGTANGRNPLSIIVPCHRVISSDGTLGGYAGGLDIKTKLLDLEKKGLLP